MNLLKLHPLEYRTWTGMKQRCLNPNNPNWKNYGGRGIKVCKRWLRFDLFLADMGPRPSPKHSIDRINNNGNYIRSNCRWATAKEQTLNRYNNPMFTYNGITKTIREWCLETGLSFSTLSQRIESGWDPEKCLYETTARKKKQPPSSGRRLIDCRDKKRRLKLRNKSRANHLRWYRWKHPDRRVWAKERHFTAKYGTFTMEDILEYDKKWCAKHGGELGQIPPEDD